MSVEKTYDSMPLTFLSTPETEAMQKKWNRINELTLAGNLIERIYGSISDHGSPPLVLTNDNVYKAGVGIPVYRREVVFVSEKFHPGFVVELRDSTRPQLFEVNLALKVHEKSQIYSEVKEKDLIQAQALKPFWWPERYGHMEVFDLTAPEDLFTTKDIKQSTHFYRDAIFFGGKIEIPVDADLGYMWERANATVSGFLIDLKSLRRVTEN